ncbi:MAG: hypothetical protein KA713_19175 [Chryseotalea sp. WA131a]|jgi:hypothetical protein|nr:MAG: hypothetical protein KA713_19175 [Chryseotalea sp. WA131a]
MSSEKLKEHLLQIAGDVKEDTRLDDIYDQLALLVDIEESEEQVMRGDFISQQEVEEKSKKWLK